jgi:hypothetical protein
VEAKGNTGASNVGSSSARSTGRTTNSASSTGNETQQLRLFPPDTLKSDDVLFAGTLDEFLDIMTGEAPERTEK